MVFAPHDPESFPTASPSKQAGRRREAVHLEQKGKWFCFKGVYEMSNEQWIADRALLRRLLDEHPEWTQPQLAAAVGRSLGFVKKWIPRFRQAPAGDQSVLFGLPCRRKTPYPQTDPLVEERILAIRDEPPENLKRIPGPKAIPYDLARDPALQGHRAPLPQSTRTIWKVLRRHGRIAHACRPHQEPIPRPAPRSAWQIDFKDASSVPADPSGKQQHVVEILNVVDMGTSIVLAAHVHANFHAQTALQAIAEVLEHQGKPACITLDRDPRWVGSASGRDFPSAFLRFLLCLGIEPHVCPPHRPDLNDLIAYCTPSAWLACCVRRVWSLFVGWRKQRNPTALGLIHGNATNSPPIPDRLWTPSIGLCGFTGR
jgi:hypothetical protein